MDVDERVRRAFAVGAPLHLGGADVPAALLAELLTGEPPTRRAALRLHEARVTGRLVLSFAEVTCPLLVQESEFVEPPDLYWARLAFTGFRNTVLPGLDAAGVTVAGHLRLSGIRSTGVVNLRGAKISGGLLLDRAHLSRPGGTALLAERLELGGDLVAEDGFRVEGTLRLFQATIAGGVHLDGATVTAPPGAPDAPPESFRNLGDGETATVRPGDAQGVDLDSATVHGGVFLRRSDVHGEISLRHATIGGVATFTGATLRNPGAVALRLDRADVGGGVHLLGGCQVEGELRLVGTRVGRILRLAGATLTNPGGHALLADNCTVDGPVDCRDGFAATGEVSLLEARVAGPVFLEGARLDNPDGTALRATGIVTGSLMHCCDGFTATGRVTMRSARIGGRLCFHDAHVQGVWCTGAEAVELDLRFAAPPAGRVDLRYLRVALLRDHPDTWPADLRLDGLTYQTLHPLLGPAQRLRWLASTSDGLPPQPYEQLAAVYRALGHDEDARTVLLAKQRRRRATRPWWTWPWSWLQDVTVGYGYRPQRAAVWLLALLVAGTAAFTAWRPVPVNPGQPPSLYPVVYTLDLLLPIIDFGQEPAFRPTGPGQWLAFAFVAAGWTLATTVAAGFTRVLTRN